ncbi:MAG: restriction endonuclease [Thiohalomonadales bacterium]
MTAKNKSIFKKMLNTVFPWLKKSDTPAKQKKKSQPSAKEVSGNDSHSSNNINSSEFEDFVHRIFIQRGYAVTEKSDNVYDGADLVLQRNNESTYVHYKDWQEQQVDVTAIGELYVAMEFDGVKHGIAITMGEFTAEALDFSLGKSLMLINGVDFSQMIEALPSASEVEADKKSEESIAAEPEKQEMPELEPLCPICSQKMIKRTAKKGKNAGNTFWGCSKFPGCRGVVPS